MLGRHALQRLAIQSVGMARHRHHAQARQPQHLQQVGVGRLLHHHRIAVAQQGADHHVQAVRHALGQEDLRYLDFHALRAEAGGDGLAQRRVAIGMAVVGDAHGWHPAQVAQGHVQPFLVQPFPGSQPQPDLMGMEWSAKMSDTSQPAFKRGGSHDGASPRRAGASGEATR